MSSRFLSQNLRSFVESECKDTTFFLSTKIFFHSFCYSPPLYFVFQHLTHRKKIASIIRFLLFLLVFSPFFRLFFLNLRYFCVGNYATSMYLSELQRFTSFLNISILREFSYYSLIIRGLHTFLFSFIFCLLPPLPCSLLIWFHPHGLRTGPLSIGPELYYNIYCSRARTHIHN